MKKTLLFILAITLTLCTLYAIQIERITDITNGEQLFEYERYSGDIIGYEDLVFINSLYSIEELEILPDGSLHRIAHFETYSTDPELLIYQDRLYVVNLGRRNTGFIFIPIIKVFDLTQRPMVQIIELGIPEAQTVYLPSVNFQGSSMYVSFEHFEGYNQTLKYDIDTFAFEGFIEPAFEGLFVRIVENTLLSMSVDSGNYLCFYHFEDDQMTLLNEFAIPLQYNNEALRGSIYASNYVITHKSGVIVVDISDVTTPAIIADVRAGSYQVKSATYTGEHIIMLDGATTLLIYQQDENGDFAQIGTKQVNTHNSVAKNLYATDDYILNMSYVDLKVFDLHTPDFDLIYSYGSDGAYPSQLTLAQVNDCYYFLYDTQTHSYDIYSILDNEVAVHIPNIDQTPQQIGCFRIKDNKLFVYVNRGGQRLFEVWDIADHQGDRISSQSLTGDFGYFLLGDTRVFFSGSNGTYAYSIEDYQLEYMGFISENLVSTQLIRQPDDYILTSSGNNVIIRDSSTLNVILDVSLPLPIEEIYFIEEFYLLIKHPSDQMPWSRPFCVYKYDFANGSVNVIDQIAPPFYTILPFKGIIANNALPSAFYLSSKYYSIINNRLFMIGEKDEKYKSVQYTLFYPERHKMVQVADSGVWVYDFTYEEYVAESDVSVPAGVAAALHGNYPNPFNPSTTISFSLGSAERVVIDVYNIRGQMVRSLVSGVYGAGSHTVVWNGCADDGVSVGSGVYFYRMVSGGFSEVRKMLLLK